MWNILCLFLIGLSCVLCFKLRFKQFCFYEIRGNKSSLMLSLATRIGVGSIIGTVSCIMIGGFGSIFWLILFSILSTSIIYYESYYGNKFKGVFNMLFKVFNSKIVFLFGLMFLVVYSFLFQMIQVNTISNMIVNNMFINKNIIFIVILLLLSLLTILNSFEILNVLNKIVPFMCLFFIIICLYGIICNIDVFNFEISFSFRSIFSGFSIGIRRSIFMNELLIGTSSESSSLDKDYRVSVMYQVISSLFVSVVISVLVASLIFIYSKSYVLEGDYILLINNVFTFLYGSSGSFILSIIFILFGITTIISGYYYGKNICEYFSLNSLIFKIMFVLIVSLSLFFEISFLFDICDFIIFFMIIINSYSIIKLIRRHL